MKTNKRTILTSGVFDVIHPGHILLFKELSNIGYLIVGVNGDRRASELKEKIIFTADERKLILESIKYIDEVIIFEEDTPTQLIEILHPDIFVKGRGWKIEDLPEYSICKELNIELVIITEEPEIKRASSEIKRNI